MSDFNTTVFDTETTATTSNALVLTLSAVKFDRFKRLSIDKLSEPEGETFHCNLSIPVQMLKGRIVDPGTMSWWQKQSQQAKDAAFFKPGREDIKQVLEEFFEFIGDTQPFCRGTDFDPPIIHSLCADFGVRPKIKYNQYRDVRTYIDALTQGNKGYMDKEQCDLSDAFTAHNSLDDCWRDAIQMQVAYSLLGEVVKPQAEKAE